MGTRKGQSSKAVKVLAKTQGHRGLQQACPLSSGPGRQSKALSVYYLSFLSGDVLGASGHLVSREVL